MQYLYSLVVLFHFEGQSHSIVAEEELTRTHCKVKARFMKNGVFQDLQIPFTIDEENDEKPIAEMVHYVCVPTKLEPK